MNAGGVLNTCKSYENASACCGKQSGARVSNAWVIYLRVRDNSAKAVLIPDTMFKAQALIIKGGLYM